MKNEIIEQLDGILLRDKMEPWNTVKNLKKYVEELKGEYQPQERTLPQNNAMWLDCEIIARKLEQAGIDWKKIIREGGIDIPATKESVMNFLWRPTMEVLYGKKSTRELSKNLMEQDKIHEVIMKNLGEKWHIEWHDFPHNELTQ